MNRRNKLVTFAVIGGGALAAAMALVTASSPETGSGSPQPATPVSAAAARLAKRGCDLHPGDRLGFVVHSRTSHVLSTVKAPASQGAAATANKPRETRTLDGELHLRVLGPAAGDSPRTLTLAAVFAHPQVVFEGTPDANLQSELAVPVLFEIDSECRLHGFAATAPITAAASNLWKGTLNLAEIVIASPGTLPGWSAEQADTTGMFVASYRRSDSAGGASTLQRTRSAYSALHDDARGAVTASVLRSTASARFLPGAGFFDDLRADEHVVLKMNGAAVADVEATLTLKAKDVAGDTGELWSRTFRAGDFALAPLDELTPPPPPLPYANRPAIEGIRSMSVRAILGDVASFLAQKPQADFDGALNELVQSLRADPTRAAALLAEIRAGNVDKDTASMIYLSLGLAGGKDAARALTAALHDPRLAESDRLQALSALAGVPDPDRAVTDTLLGVREPRGAAVLALGTLAHNKRVSPEEKTRVLGALEDELRRASSAADRANAIAALGNAGDATLRQRVAGFVDSTEPGVAAAAYRSLKKMNALPPAGELLDAYIEAKDPQTQAAVADALAAAKPGTGEVTRAAGLLGQSQPAAARATLIRLLGSVSRDNAAAKAALVRHYHAETEPALLTLLGRYLQPSDLI